MSHYFASRQCLDYIVRWKRLALFCIKLGTVIICVWILLTSVLLSSDDPTNLQQAVHPNIIKELPQEDKGIKVGLNVRDRGWSGGEEEVHVCFTSDRNTVIGTMAAINSVVQNTRHKVKFHIIVEQDIVDHVRHWLSESQLKRVDAEVIGFDVALLQGKIKVRGGRTELAKPMNYARFLYSTILPNVQGRLVHLDDDVIVQGDIAELANIRFLPGQIAAFAEDCVSMSKRFSLFENVYVNFLNFRNEHIKKLNLDPKACSFNTGVFVTDLGDWRPRNISERLLYWIKLNTRENIYGNQKGGGGSQPPMMIVFYKQYATMDPLWHIRSLGSSKDSKRYSIEFIKGGKLLHWNGRLKPWSAMAPYQNIWDRYYVPDPTGEYEPVRRKRRLPLRGAG